MCNPQPGCVRVLQSSLHWPAEKLSQGEKWCNLSTYSGLNLSRLISCSLPCWECSGWRARQHGLMAWTVANICEVIFLDFKWYLRFLTYASFNNSFTNRIFLSINRSEKCLRETSKFLCALSERRGSISYESESSSFSWSLFFLSGFSCVKSWKLLWITYCLRALSAQALFKQNSLSSTPNISPTVSGGLHKLVLSVHWGKHLGSSRLSQLLPVDDQPLVPL